MVQTLKTGASAPRLLAFGAWAVAVGYAIWSALPFVGGVEDRDFAIFWLAGKAALAGHPQLAYDQAWFAGQSRELLGVVHSAIPHPPTIFLLFAPLALLPMAPAFLVWNGISALLFVWAARPYMPGVPSILAMLTPAACISFALGQTGLFIGALWLIAFRGHPWAVGLLTLKPHIGWMTALTLDQPRKFVMASASALALIILAAILFPAAFADFPDALARHGSYLGSKAYKIWYFQVVSPRFGYGLIGWLLFAGAATALLWRRFNVFTAATASLLITPYALHYDMTVACLGMGLALLRERRPIFQFLLLFGFFTPYVVLVGTTWFAPPLILGALVAQVFGEPANSASIHQE
ncbi:MAG TPA: glycosyltransferase 87 family protein [Sphingomicrobium sp.]|nr:glycosyltransferase 87 family protein [Sphingomicrobium sp.]